MTKDFSMVPGAPKAPNLCDIDGTGDVGAVDVQLVINRALDLPVNGYADVGRNGAVDAIDVQRVINSVLGITC